MIDENHQAEALRNRLDQELAGVRATVAARERLDSRIAPQLRTHRPRPGLLRLPAALALPLAAASIVAAVVAVPALLRTNDSMSVPPASDAPADPPPIEPTASMRPAPREPATAPAPAAAAAAGPRTSQAPAVVPRPSAAATGAPEPTAVGALLSLRVRPTRATVGDRVQLSLPNAPAGHGGVTVTWGDGSRRSTVRGDCSGSPRQAIEPLPHVYALPGQYLITVVLDDCRAADRRATLELTVLDRPSTR
jgi:hypothetical protein